MVAKSALVTAQELLDMPDDDRRYELVRGELRKRLLAGAQHGKLAAKVAAALFNYVKANNLGKVYAAGTGFLIGADPDHVRAPDAAFVRRERVDAVGEVAGFWPGAPDLAVEVISPGDRYTEVEEKVDDWLAAGAAMVVLVNPRNRTATVRRPSQDPVILMENDTIDGGEVIPGWRMAVGELFS